MRESAGRKQIITDQKKFKAKNDPIVLNIASGFYWQEMIDSGKITNIRELAKIMNVNESYVGRTIRLTMLSPEIIHRAIRGTLPEDISLAKLYKLPDRWEEQLKQLGIAVEKNHQQTVATEIILPPFFAFQIFTKLELKRCCCILCLNYDVL